MCQGLEVYGKSVLSVQFCWEPKTALKYEVYLKEIYERIYTFSKSFRDK